MDQKPKPASASRRPLWVIAISLAVIAICFVMLVVQKELDRVPPGESSPISAVRKSSAPQPNLPAVTRHPRRLAGEGTQTETATAAVSESELLIAGSERQISTADGAAPVAAGPGSFAVLSGTNGTGEIVGKVVLHGTPPPEEAIAFNRDSECGRSRTEPLMTRRFIVSSNGGLANVVVFVKQSAGMNWSLPTNRIELALTNCQIEPYVSAAMSAQAMHFRSRDGATHKIEISSPDHPNHSATFVVRPGDEGKQANFRDPALLTLIQCQNHPWERAIVSVLGNPLSAVTDRNGDFRISNLRPGRYLLGAFHAGATGTNTISRIVTVTAQQVTAANFTLEAPKPPGPAFESLSDN